MSSEFVFKADVPMLVGGDWINEAMFFSGTIYFADITHEIFDVTEINKIIFREKSKIKKVEVTTTTSTVHFFGITVDDRRCVESCISGTLPDMPNGP